MIVANERIEMGMQLRVDLSLYLDNNIGEMSREMVDIC